MEVKSFGPPVLITDDFITESYKDGLPEAELILLLARKTGNEFLIAFMQNAVDNMKQWIEDHPEVIK